MSCTCESPVTGARRPGSPIVLTPGCYREPLERVEDARPFLAAPQRRSATARMASLRRHAGSPNEAETVSVVLIHGGGATADSGTGCCRTSTACHSPSTCPAAGRGRRT